MGLFDFVKTTAETAELHDNKDLRTRYYKTGYSQVKDQILGFAKKQGFTVKNINDAHGEIFVQTNKFHAIISVIQVTPLETACDIKIQTYGVFGMSVPKNTILSIYEHLNKNLPFKGISLHP